MQGERSLPRVVDRRYDLLALEWVQRPERATAWGMQRGRAASPLAKMCCSTTHILRALLSAILTLRRLFSGYTRLSKPRHPSAKEVAVVGLVNP